MSNHEYITIMFTVTVSFFLVSESIAGSPVSQNDKTWNMVRRIEEMLFPTDSEENIVSEKSELFQVLMCEFNIYEVSWKLINIQGILLYSA